MSYTDHVRSSSRPSCWGEEHNYDPNDPECSDCRWRTSCSAACDGAHSRPRTRTQYNRTQYNRTQSRPETSDMGEAGTGKPGIIEADERPIERFAKDAVGGGLRGMFYEMWQFWRHYRIR